MQENSTLPQPTRQHSNKREKGQTTGSRYGAARQGLAATIPDSLGAIAFKTKKGLEIERYAKMEDNDFQEMVSDISGIYSGISGLPKVAPSGNQALDIVNMITNIKEAVPKHVEILFYKDYDNHWRVTLYKEVKWSYGWSAFPVGKVLKVLQKEDTFLHQVFMEFIKALCLIGVDPWYHGIMGNEIDNLDERFANLADELDSEAEKRAWFKTMYNYTRGLAAWHELQLRNMGTIKIEWLEEGIKHYKRHPIAIIMREGIKLLKTNKKLYDYVMPHPDKSEYTYLPFVDQYTIAWSLKDEAAAETEEMIDCSAQEGVEEPVQYMEITNGMKIKNFKKVEKDDTFVHDLQTFFDRTNFILSKIKKYAE